jgi:tetratricopeptide (TPR) repeat protein
MGRRDEALEAIQQAVEIQRKLAVEHPAAFNPNLATFLGNLSNCLSDMGRRDEALEAIQQAVEIRRKLAWNTLLHSTKN